MKLGDDSDTECLPVTETVHEDPQLSFMTLEGARFTCP